MEQLLVLGTMLAVAVGVSVPGEIHPEMALVVVPALLLLPAVSLLLPRHQTSRGLRAAGILLAACGVVSVAGSANRDDWRRAAPLLVAGAFAYLAGRRVGSSRDRNLALSVLALPLVLAAGLAVHQKVWGFDELRRELATMPGLSPVDRQTYLDRLDIDRPFAQFALPGPLGAFAGAMTLLYGGAALAARDWRRVALIVLAASAAVTFVLALSLGSALATLGAVAILATGRRIPARVALPLGALGVLVLAAIVIHRGGALHPRGSLRLRLENWKAAGRIAVQHPLSGVGVGGFADAYPGVVAATANRTKHAHSFVARCFAELGFVGGLASLALVVLSLREACAVDPARHEWDVAWPLAALSLGLHALLDVDMDVESFALFTPFVVGVAGAPAAAPPPRRSAAVAGIGLTIGLLACAAYVIQGRSRVLVANASDLAREGRREEARDALREATRIDPHGSVAHMLLGRELAVLGRHADAILLLERAKALTPDRGVVRLPLALSYAAVGRPLDACREAREAARLLPRDEQVLSAEGVLCSEPEPSAQDAS